MGGKMSRTKGHSYERSIANKLKCVFPNAKRHLESQMEECKGYDLDHTGPYRIQLKRYKKYVSIGKIEEVHEEEGTIPILITKGDHKPDMVVMPLTHFIHLIGGCNDKKNSKESCEKSSEKENP